MAIYGKQGSAAYQGYPAYKARQGEIILKTRLQRVIFMVGLTGLFVAAVVVSILR
jgi:hypothetical protein